MTLLAQAALAGSAPAATITVTSPPVADDFGVTDPGTCALREAVQLASLDAMTSFGGCTVVADDELDVIQLQGGQTYALTRTGAGEDLNNGGDLDVREEPLTFSVTGPGQATISCDTGCNDRVLDVAPGGEALTVTASDFVIQDGDGGINGGNVRNGTGSTLNLDRSVVRSNDVQVGGGGGGGLFNPAGGTVMVTNSTVKENQAGTAGGGAGGGITNQGTMTISGSTLNNNSAEFGGGIELAASGTTTLSNVTISDNKAHNDGGGIFKAGTTVLNLRNVTIAVNTANFDTADGLDGGGGGITRLAGGTVNLRNTIIAQNIDTPSAEGPAEQHPDCTTIGGTYTSEGFNLVGNSDGCASSLTIDDIQNMNPMLGALQNNGGLTETRALSGGPALDAGNPATPGSGGLACEATDQRGFGRGGTAGRCDIGAFEAPPAPAGSPSVPPLITTAAAQTGLRAAALKKCKKKKTAKARKKCKKNAQKLPV